MPKKEILGLVGFLLGLTLFISGCSVSEVQDSVKGFIGGNKEAIDKAQEAKQTIEEKNPVFSSEEGIEAINPVAKDVDGVVQKTLSNVFSQTKLISGGNTDNTPFILKYIVSRRINQSDGDLLYQELLNQGCSPKGDAGPQFFSTRNTVEITVTRNVGGRSYILGVVMDLAEQVIWVNVY